MSVVAAAVTWLGGDLANRGSKYYSGVLTCECAA